MQRKPKGFFSQSTVGNRPEMWGSATENSLLKDLGGKTSVVPSVDFWGLWKFMALLNC